VIYNNGPLADWPIGARHDEYGTVEMCAVTGGESYRWFVDDDGVVSMIPLSALQEQPMNQRERDELIETMVLAMANNGAEGNTEELTLDVIAAIHAAKERGYVLAKLPEQTPSPAGAWKYEDGWNDCLDAIEVVRLDEQENKEGSPHIVRIKEES
jgi:hypothetical protein